ncbi:non-ribosomal peptide synthetase [Parachitinimonas caeni]|uniref:Amino acid adenylation domain-containing protein n=1 Tax=Parachitinimonas caeni TaxID=3031301 RepID=A0ABT7DTR7_9NEIS|nr:non-ribosomal peptide synthetase [Parachitinimonas caeni]MDK2123471.1 amino acid adenylation domain-containing protein [Parachitinimonas caeni]
MLTDAFQAAQAPQIRPDSPEPAGQGVCVHALFERQVAATPERVAVSLGEQTLTYAALNRRANRLARLLRLQAGDTPAVIGICLERGIEAIVAILATLKAGAAYVPVDSAYPAERQAYIVQDSGVAVLISRRSQAQTLPTSAACLFLDDLDLSDDGPDAGRSGQNLDPLATPDDLAYLIYTSGSTGAPKGVCMPHRALANLIDWQLHDQRSHWGECLGRRTLQFSPLSFDVSFQEIFATLASGGELVLITQALRLDPLALLAFIEAEHVARIFLPYVALNSLALAATAQDHYPASLIDVVTAGEQLVITPAIRQFFKALPGCRLHNHYGPSEAHVVTACTLSGPPEQWPALPSIGRPIAGVEIALLGDDNRQPEPGEPGELCIGGVQLAYGYHQRPQETAARFVDLDIDGRGPRRLYRSGDLARQLPDGQFELLGRMDAQVKIRGFRVELGEVEALLMRHPAVDDAVVVVQGEAADDKRLVAFVIAAERVLQRQTEASARDSIRQLLQASAPDYLQPAAIVFVSRFPLAASGKIDRRAFPQIDCRTLAQTADAPPQTEPEAVLATVWGEVLGVSGLGRNAHFFQLGGHSLLMVKVMLALRQRGYAVDVQTLYQQPVLSELALQLKAAATAEADPARQPDVTTSLLATLSPAEQQCVAAAVPGGLANVQAVYPLGPLQQGMLYHALAHPEGDPYVLWQLVRFDSENLLLRWLDALRGVIARHDALRVSVLHQGLAQPLQVVWREAALEVERLASPDPLAEIRYRCQPARQRFDLARAPLQRCCYGFDATSNQWVLLHQLHHLTVDHATVEHLQQEIEAQLRGETLTATSTLPAPVSAAHAPQHTAFFDELLQGFEPGPAPLDAERPLAGDACVVEAWQTLDGGLAEQLRQQARIHGVSVAALFHLAWAKVVACLSGRDDVVFGTVLLGRLHLGEQAQTAMGQFINTLPIRLQLQAGSVLDGLWQTQDRLSQLLEHEQAPLVLAQKSAQLPGHTPLFTTLFNYRHSEINQLPAADPFQTAHPATIAGMAYSGVIERTTYPLSVNVDDFGKGFAINVQVEQGQDPQRVGMYFETALHQLATALAANPQQRLGRLCPMPAAEQDVILHQWNQTAAEFPQHRCLHELIEAQVQRTPFAMAVEFDGQSVTYQALNQRANQLARLLQADMAVGPDTLVGVCAERSVEMVVALLAVLKAGGAYVPFDPHYPADRLHYMLRDARPGVVLSHRQIPEAAQALLRDYAAETGARVVDLNDDADRWAQRDDADLSIGATGLMASHLAYVIYTSGSTGRPKGVMNAHRGVVNRLLWMQKAYPLSAADAVLQKTPFSFDVSVWEFFWPLMFGARLVVAKPEGHKDPAYLNQLIHQHRITTLHFVPSMLAVFLEHVAAAPAPSLRQVFCSGEALPLHSVRRFRQRYPQVALHNLYGPTEAAIDVTAWDCSQEAPGGVIPIGRPIDNIRIHILDAHGQPCPVGVIGELYIAGVGVARGYLNRPDLTAEKFIDDPFNPDSSGTEGRMYRTGDLARYLPEGDIEYLGRNDFQVKLRGFRIELGEVEAALRSHPAVQDCVVLVREDTPGDARLVAYLVQASGADEATQSLRQHLQSQLPAFMLPSNLIWLDALPLTSNGKLDRKALPTPADLAEAMADETPLAEGTETQLAELWGELLGRSGIGKTTHFFEAGGHSLLAVALMTKIQQRFGVELPLSALVAHLELGAMAALIDTELSRGVEQSGLSPAMPAGGRILALPAQKAIYKAVKLNPHDLSNNSFVALAFAAEPDPKALRQLLQSVFSRHESLSARFVLDDGELVLQPAPRFLFRMEKRQTLGSLEEDLRDFVRPFSLEDGINVRGRWVSDGPQPLLLLDFSHACIDGSGLQHLLAELAAGEDSLPAAGSLGRYSQRFYSDDWASERQQHAEFWHGQLQDWPANPPATATQPLTRSWQFALDAPCKARIDALAARLRISASEFFMAVFLHAKTQAEGRADQLVSMIFHGRDLLAQQAVMAPLMTVLPLRLGHSAATLSAATLSEVSTAVRTACRHYLFDAEALAARWPALSRQALFPSAFFGFFQREGFAGQIAGQPCHQLETPNIAGGVPHWNLTCEIAEHPAGFDVRLECLAFPCLDTGLDWEALFRSTIDQALATDRAEN